MTKRVNKLFLIVAVFFLLLSILIPVVDYYMTKYIVFGKYEGMTALEMQQILGVYESEISGNSYINYSSFYVFFYQEYNIINKDSIIYKAVNTLQMGEFSEITVWYPTVVNQDGETMFLFYILDKVLWLFVAYCIFVIPISMVDLFSKMIKKGVE